MDSATPVVVDTDVVSFLFKTHPFAPAYQAILADRSLAVSLITLAEVEYGMQAKNWGAARRDLMRRFSRTLYTPPAGRGNGSYVGADQERLREERPAHHIRGCLDRGRSLATQRATRHPQRPRL
jgi:predicted nucleic acid-binding protein